MKRLTLLNILMTMYPNFFNEKEKTQVWMDAYKQVIPEDLDCSKLYRAMLVEYTSSAYPPAPSWFYQQWLVLKEKDWQEFKKNDLPESGVPPTPEFLALAEKFSMRKETECRSG